MGFLDWRGLVDQFLNQSITFDFTLQRIQTTFSELKIQSPAI